MFLSLTRAIMVPYCHIAFFIPFGLDSGLRNLWRGYCFTPIFTVKARLKEAVTYHSANDRKDYVLRVPTGLLEATVIATTVMKTNVGICASLVVIKYLK